MNKSFLPAALDIKNSFVENWRKQGGKVIGYTCSFLPPEILQAMDILPYRIRGQETKDMSIGDAFFGPYICSFPKCVLQLAGEGKYSFLDGVVITPGCDSMRRLDDCWRAAAKEHPKMLPEFSHYFHVPHKRAAYSYQWFTQEIKKLILAVEQKFSCQLTYDRLLKAMEMFNQGRRLYQSLEEMRCQDKVGIKGREAFAVAVASTVMPRKDFNHHLADLVNQLGEKPLFTANGHKRLLLIGSISDDLELVELLEEGEQAVVVGENLCFGVRFAGPEISTQADDLDSLLMNLAQSYLGRSLCPRMFGLYNERLQLLLDKIKLTRAQGVVMQNIRFCDLHGSENGLIERDLEKQGIPCLKLEREYGPLVDKGRLKMRIDAFLERLAT